MQAEREDSAIELIVPKVYKGEGVFNRVELFRYEKSRDEKDTTYFVSTGSGTASKVEPDPDEFQLDRIVGLYTGELDKEPGVDILAAGDRRAFILAADGKVKKEIDYKLGRYSDGSFMQNQNFPFIQIADLDKDDSPEIAGHGAYACEIKDLSGKTVWKYPGKKGEEKYSGIDALRIGDIDNDGENEVLVGKTNTLEAFDKKGNLKWRIKNSGYGLLDLEVTDLDGDGKNEILAGESIYDGKGELIEKMKTRRSIQGLLTQKNELPTMLFFDKDELSLFRSGKLIKKLEAPQNYKPRKKEEIDPKTVNFGVSTYGGTALYLTAGPDRQKFLVVLADSTDNGGYEAFKTLYIYDSRDKLIYHETVRAFYGEIAVLPNNDGTESLLVTDDGKLLKYSLN
jgi:hypothetical protein